MEIYCLMHMELGWDSVVSVGRTLREAVEDYNEDDDLSDLSDEEIQKIANTYPMRYTSHILKD